MWLRPGIVASGAAMGGGASSITAASIESNGWVMQVTMTGTPSSVSDVDSGGTNFSAYTQAPNTGMPLALSALTSGYVQSSGQAVSSSSVSRSLTATKPLRKPVETYTLWNPNTAYVAGQQIANGTNTYTVTTGGTSGNAGGPTGTGSSISDGTVVWSFYLTGVRKAKRPDETNNGNGTITVRIALSQHVYATDTALTLSAQSGWRTGASASSGISVTNNSIIAAPAPIVRWSDVPYQLQPGSFNLEIVTASHHPKGLAPVAGVNFTVTDGTTVKNYWSTALSTSSVYSAGGTGLGMRVYSVAVDPTVATAFTKGLLRCDFEVYPWIGPAQKSDTTGTRSMTTLGTTGLSTASLIPFVVAYNPGNTWITPLYVDVDEVNGTATTASITVNSNPATAAAGTPANSINAAINALALANVTLAAANGQSSAAKSLDGCHIRIRKANAGTGCTGIVNGTGGGAGLGPTTNSTWLVIEGDPTDSTGRACILRSPSSAAGVSRISRARIANLSIEAQNNPVTTGIAYFWVDNFEVRAVSGQSATAGLPIGSTNALQYYTNGKWWQHGSFPAPSGTTSNPVLIRNLSAERTFGAPLVANCARLPTAIAGTKGVVGGATQGADPGNIERIIIGCDLRYLNTANAYSLATMTNSAAPANLTLNTTWLVSSRQAVINNVTETYGGAGYPLWNSIGENNPVTSTENIIEGNTHTGDRTNLPYDDLNMSTVALNDTTNNTIQMNRIANNIYMGAASKHDFFNDPAVMAQRIGVALSATRSKAYVVGAEIVIAGSPGNIYHCTTAGTTASTGGPTGTGSAISDGSVVWQWIATENRHHGYRPNAIGGWSSHYGVLYEGNIDYRPASVQDPEFLFEFFGIGSDQLGAEGITVTSTPFTNDQSGGPNRQPFQPLPSGNGGGDYKPLSSGSGLYAIGRAHTANTDIDERGVSRAATFTAGSIEA